MSIWDLNTLGILLINENQTLVDPRRLCGKTAKGKTGITADEFVLAWLSLRLMIVNRKVGWKK